MKRLFAGFLCFFLVSSMTGCVSIVENTQPKIIAVVSKEDESAFWNTVLIGAEDAGLQNDYGITFRGPAEDGPEGLEAQRKILELALENHASAIVIAAVSPGLTDLMKIADQRNIPVIQFDSGLFPQDLSALKREKIKPMVSSVYTDNRAAGRLSAEHLFETVRSEIAESMVPYAVGVLQHDMSHTGIQRAMGFLERFYELGEENPETAGKFLLKLEKCKSPQDGAYGKALDSLKKQGCRAVFLTNQNVVEQVYQKICDTPEKYDYMIFTGFDSGKLQLEWLQRQENPRLIGSVTQDPYALGYNAVLQAVNGLEARGVTAFVEIPAIFYDLNNLEAVRDRNVLYE